MSMSFLPRLFASRFLQLTLYIIICISLILAAGCGKKGPVRPKLATPSSAPSDLTLQQRGNLFVLGWDIPSSGRDSETEAVTSYRIKRLTYDGGEGCPTCRDPRQEVAVIDLHSPDPAQLIGSRVYWRDLDIRPGNGYRYAVVPLTAGKQEGPAATVHLSVRQPPPAPAGLEATAGDTRVSLQWQRPDLPAGMTLVGYNLYRRQAKRVFPMVPVNVKPLKETRLLDRGLDNGRAYEYRVSTLVEVDDQRLESNTSSAILITPQ